MLPTRLFLVRMKAILIQVDDKETIMNSLFARIVTELRDDITLGIKWGFAYSLVPGIFASMILLPMLLSEYGQSRIVGVVVIGTIVMTAIAVDGTMREVWKSKAIINSAKNGLVAATLPSLMGVVMLIAATVFLYFDPAILGFELDGPRRQVTQAMHQIALGFMMNWLLIQIGITVLLAVTGWCVGILVARLKQRKDSESS